MTTYINNKYMLVAEENGVLSLTWKKETINFTDDEFKKEALNFIEVVKKHQSKKILVDMRNFNYQLTDDVLDWRNEYVITAYNEIGVEKFAFVSEKPSFKQGNPKNTFVTETFKSKDSAIDWLIAE